MEVAPDDAVELCDITVMPMGGRGTILVVEDDTGVCPTTIDTLT